MNTLKTPWTDFTGTTPLSSYPRPQLARKEWLCLNGEWDYCVSNGAIPSTDAFKDKILVPFSPEAPLSGAGFTLKQNDILWYRRTVQIPNYFNKGLLLLHFGAVDQACTVYINGNVVTTHDGGYWPFSVDITTYADNEFEIIVKVSDPTNATRGKQSTKPGGIWYTPQSGIWQTVWLESVPTSYIKGLKITPDFDNSSVSLKIDALGKASCTVSIFDGDKLVGSGDSLNALIAIESFMPWTPQAPFLYDVVINYGEDEIRSYFGMRKFSLGKDVQGNARLCLNNKPYFASGVLDQGYWPDGLYTPSSDEAMIYDIEQMKALGFNMLRKHIKIEPLRWYYHCDRLGMLVWQDMVSGGGDYKPMVTQYLPFVGVKLKDNKYKLFAREDKADREHFYTELSDTVDVLYNCVCISLWTIFNEGWGQFDAQKATKLLRSLDDTRCIDSTSGWHDQATGDCKSPHIYYKKYRYKKNTTRAVVLSEFGGYSLWLKGHSFSDTAFGYKLFSDKDKLNAAIKLLYEREVLPAAADGLSASVYTQLSDVEQEVNGMLTYDRKTLKIDKLMIREINSILCKNNG